MSGLAWRFASQKKIKVTQPVAELDGDEMAARVFVFLAESVARHGTDWCQIGEAHAARRRGAVDARRCLARERKF